MDVEVMGSYKNVWRWLSSQLAGDLYEDASEEEDNDAEDELEWLGYSVY